MWVKCDVIVSNKETTPEIYILSNEIIREKDIVYDSVDDHVFVCDSISLGSGLIRSKEHSTVLKGCKKVVVTNNKHFSQLPQIEPRMIEYILKNGISIIDVYFSYTIDKSLGNFFQQRSYFAKTKNEIFAILSVEEQTEFQEKKYTLTELKNAFSFFAFKTISNQPYNKEELNEMFEKYLSENNLR